jgi:hypothetical protein
VPPTLSVSSNVKYCWGELNKEKLYIPIQLYFNNKFDVFKMISVDYKEFDKFTERLQSPPSFALVVYFLCVFRNRWLLTKMAAFTLFWVRCHSLCSTVQTGTSSNFIPGNTTYEYWRQVLI